VTRIALVTCRAARGLDEDMPALVAAFAATGATAEIVDWDDTMVEWSRFDAALLRSAWDYAERRTEFLAWAERTAAETALFNPLSVVRWNSDKHYLGELAQAGLPVVPTSYAETPADATRVLAEFLARHGASELVVKPAVGAGARGARRHDRTATGETLAHMRALLEEGRSVMLQPYLEDVDTGGESALMFIDGRFSHTVRKGALLPRGAQATAGLFAPEEIGPRTADAAELAVAERILARLPFDRLLYARVDLVRDGEGEPRLLELEITEPSLYLSHEPGSAARLVSAVLKRLSPGRARSSQLAP
jgi:glutathione synthase/RimK-type ligase-like ATP-grasp enzyme